MKYRDDAERLRRPMLVAAGIIVNSLVDHDFSGVERMTDGRYLTATDLEHAIAGIGGTLMSAPVFSYDDLTFEAVADDPPTFETRIPLWTAEHGRTKTVLILRFHEWEGIHDVVQSQVVGVTASVG